MKLDRLVAALVAIAVSVSLLTAPTAAQAPAQDDIVATAVKAGSFKTLAAALEAAGLVSTLKGKGPFTVFAPTDDAFAKVPKDVLESLLKPENKKQLQAVLTYHVVAGSYPAARITKAKAKTFGLKSVEGSHIPVDLRRGVTVDGATVVKTDVLASNGVIHVIDAVILPPSVKRELAKPGKAAEAHGVSARKRGSH